MRWAGSMYNPNSNIHSSGEYVRRGQGIDVMDK